MAILRKAHNRQNPFLQISRNSIKDMRIFGAPFHLLCFCLDKPDDWKISVRSLQKELNMEEKKVLRMIRILIDAGYVVRYQLIGEESNHKTTKRHTFGRVEYHIFEESQTPEQQTAYILEVKKMFPQPHFPPSGKKIKKMFPQPQNERSGKLDSESSGKKQTSPNTCTENMHTETSSNARAREDSEVSEGRIAESAAGAAAAAASSNKNPKPQKTAAPPKPPQIPDCLKGLNLLPDDVDWLANAYDPTILKEAVRWTQAKEQAREIKTSFVQCLKHACSILQKGGVLSDPGKGDPHKEATQKMDAEEVTVRQNKKLARTAAPHIVQKNPNSAPDLTHPAFFSMRDLNNKYRQIEWFRPDFAKLLMEICGIDVTKLE